MGRITADEMALAFINKFHAKKVGGSTMKIYLVNSYERFGQAMYNHGHKDGVNESEYAWKKGILEGTLKGFDKGYEEGLKTKQEMPIWPQYKMKCMYRIGYSPKLTIAMIVSSFGISHQTFYNRLSKGYSHSEALTGVRNK